MSKYCLFLIVIYYLTGGNNPTLEDPRASSVPGDPLLKHEIKIDSHVIGVKIYRMMRFFYETQGHDGREQKNENSPPKRAKSHPGSTSFARKASDVYGACSH